MSPILIPPYPPDVTKSLCYLIDTFIKECDCYDAQKLFAQHCGNGSSQIQGIDFYQYHITVANTESFRINIVIVAIHILTAITLDVFKSLHYTNFPTNERVCVSPPPYYLDWYEKYYPNVPLNRY